MPTIAVFAAKGGQGTSTIAAALALSHARDGRRTLLIDTSGDQPAVLNCRSGFTTPRSGPTVNVTANLYVIQPAAEIDTRAYDLVVVDAGIAPASLQAEHRILVTRPCYLALARATTLAVRPSGVVVVNEPGRALDHDDIEAVIGVPVSAKVPFDASIARAIDAGLLSTALPAALSRSLRPLVRATAPAREIGATR